MKPEYFPIRKGEVIELGEGHSSTAKRDGIAYFDGDSVKMLPAITVPERGKVYRFRAWLAEKISPTQGAKP